jgi:type IV pilus assembly protein PilM
LHVPYFYAAAAAGIVLAALLQLGQRSSRPTVVAVDVGHSAIKVAQLSRGSNPTLLRWSITETPPGAVAGGLIQNRDAVVEALQAAMDAARIDQAEVVTVMTGQTLVLQHLDFPRVREGELRQMVADQITAHVPLPPEEILYDYQLAPTERDDLSRVLLVATQRDPVTSLVETMREAGLAPTRVDIEPLAAYRAVFGQVAAPTRPAMARRQRRPGRTSAAAAKAEGDLAEQAALGQAPAAQPIETIVDLGAGTSNVSIYRNGVLQLQRVLRVAGHDLTQAVASAMRVSDDEAEHLKRAHGLETDSPISFAINPVAESLFREIRLSLEYYHSRHREVRFGDVMLIGGNARLKGFAEQLQDHLSNHLEGLTDVSGLRVQMPRSAGRIEAHASTSEAEDPFPVLAVALGLALREVDALGSH